MSTVYTKVISQCTCWQFCHYKNIFISAADSAGYTKVYIKRHFDEAGSKFESIGTYTDDDIRAIQQLFDSSTAGYIIGDDELSEIMVIE